MKANLHDECRTRFGFCKALTTVSRTPVIDRRGYNGVEFHLLYGLTASVADTQTVVVLECDTTTTGSFTSVADGDLIGTEALASRLAVTGHTSGTSINCGKRIGYKGNKRYVRLQVTPGGTATMIVGCAVQLFNPVAAPTTNP